MKVRLAYLCCCLLWGSTWMVIKLGLRDLPPLRFAAIRMLLAAAVLLPFAARTGLRSLPLRAPLIGLLQIGVPYALLFAAQQWVPSGLAAVLFSSFPVWLVLVARVLLPGEHFTPRKLLAAALGVAGVLVLQLPALRSQAVARQAVLGGGLIVLAAIVIAVANVLVRMHLRPYAPVAVTFAQVAAGAMLITVAALFERGRPAAFTPLALAAIVYLAVFGTALTYLFLFWLIPRVPISAIGAIPLLDTTVAVILGALVLHEPFGLPLVGGGALVLAGAALANASPAPPAPEGA